MLVNSIPFFIFFTIVFLPYFTLWKDKLRAQNLWLLLASYFFYGWVSWEMVFLLHRYNYRVLLYRSGNSCENIRKGFVQ